MRLLALVFYAVMFHPDLMRADDPDLAEKLSQAKISRLEFRHANAVDVLDLLIKHAVSSPPKFPSSLGLIQADNPDVDHETYVLEFEDGTPLELPAMTMDYVEITALEAINRVTQQLGLTYQLSDNRIELFASNGKRIVRTEKVEQGDASDSSPATGSEPDDR